MSFIHWARTGFWCGLSVILLATGTGAETNPPTSDPRPQGPRVTVRAAFDFGNYPAWDDNWHGKGGEVQLLFAATKTLRLGFGVWHSRYDPNTESYLANSRLTDPVLFSKSLTLTTTAIDLVWWSHSQLFGSRRFGTSTQVSIGGVMRASSGNVTLYERNAPNGEKWSISDRIYPSFSFGLGLTARVSRHALLETSMARRLVIDGSEIQQINWHYGVGVVVGHY